MQLINVFTRGAYTCSAFLYLYAITKSTDNYFQTFVLQYNSSSRLTSAPELILISTNNTHFLSKQAFYKYVKIDLAQHKRHALRYVTQISVRITTKSYNCARVFDSSSQRSRGTIMSEAQQTNVCSNAGGDSAEMHTNGLPDAPAPGCQRPEQPAVQVAAPAAGGDGQPQQPLPEKVILYSYIRFALIYYYRILLCTALNVALLYSIIKFGRS